MMNELTKHKKESIYNTLFSYILYGTLQTESMIFIIIFYYIYLGCIIICNSLSVSAFSDDENN